MDSPTFKVPPSSGAPLLPISPERMNQQRLAMSPSMPADLSELAKGSSRHSRNLSTASDVQLKVAAFNNLTRESSTQRLATDAALKRAIVGREEAESELQDAKAQLTESRDRERRVGERLESLFEELATAKERQTHERSVFEKEVRRARKEAFKAGSVLVKLQEELKAVRGEAGGLKDELRKEKTSRANAEQKNFEMDYKLAGMDEEAKMLRQKLDVLEAAKNIEVATIEQTEPKVELSLEEMDRFWEKTPQQTGEKSTSSGKNRFARKASQRGDELRSSGRWRFPGRQSFMPIYDSDDSPSDDEENIETLKSELRREKRDRVSAEEMVHFLKMECQFQRCSCRVAEAQGTRYIHDHEFDQRFQKMEEERRQKPQGSNTLVAEPEEQPAEVDGDQSHREASQEGEMPRSMEEPASENLISFSPTTGTFHAVASPVGPEPNKLGVQEISPADPFSPLKSAPPIVPDTPSPEPQRSPVPPLSSPIEPTAPEDIMLPTLSPTASPQPIRIPISFATPASKVFRPLESTPHRAPNTLGAMPARIFPNTITTTIPLAIAADDVFSPAEGATPISRAEALEQIRARRGRARSLVMGGGAVRKGLLGVGAGEIGGERRDISAPAGKC